MRKFLLLAAFFLITSCNEMIENIGCGMPSYVEQSTAQSLYGDIFSVRVSMDYDKARKIFGCYYTRGDLIYTYSRLFDSGYILVRGDAAIAYRKAK